MISTWLLLIMAGTGAAGWMTSREDPRDRPLIFLIGIPVFSGGAGLLLADAGLFSMPLMLLLGGVWAVTGAWRMRTHPRFQVNRKLAGLFLLFTVLCLLVFSRPHTYLHGGWDPGEYVSTSAQIHRSGHIRYQDPLLPELPSELHATFFRNPVPPRATLHAGYLIMDEETGEMVPDYFHLYPVWLALFQPAARIASAYQGQTLIAVLAMLIFGLFVLRSTGPRMALFATAGLLANPAILYFGRFPSSELLSLTQLFACFTFLSQREEQQNPLSWLWIALTAYTSLTCHITNLLPLTAAGLVVGLQGLFKRDRGGILDAVAVFGGMGLGVVRNSLVTPIFIQHLFKTYLLERPGYVLGMILAVLGGAALGWICWNLLRPRLPAGLRSPGAWRLLAALLILGMGLYHYFLRPRLFETSDAINLRSLGWLFSPAGLLPAFGAFFIRPQRPLSRTLLFLLAAGGFSALVLLQAKYVQPYYMWAFRRYLPMVIPFFVLLIAYTLTRLSRLTVRGIRLSPWVHAGFVLLAGWQVYAARHLIRIQEHRGLPAHVERLAESIPEADFILIDHWKLSSPLRIGFGLPVYQLSSEAEPVDEERQAALHSFLLEKLEAGQRFIYISHSPRPFYLPGYHPKALGHLDHQAEILRWTRHGLPEHRQMDGSPAHLFEFRPGPDPDFTEIDFDIGYHSIGLIKGFDRIRQRPPLTSRWTDGDAALYIPGLAEGGTLTLTLSHGRPHDFPDTLEVQVLLDGDLLQTLSIQRDWDSHTVQLPPGSKATHVLQLKSATWDAADYDIHGYPPDLGISISHLRLSK